LAGAKARVSLADMGQRLLLALFACLVAACSGGPCGGGESAGGYCAYPSAIVIEGGFACPAAMPARFDFGGATLCGPAGTSRDRAREACIEAGFECGPPSCDVAPDDEDCEPASCREVPRRFAYVTEEAAEASCEERPCRVCPEHVIGETTLAWMVIESTDCPCPLPVEPEMLRCDQAFYEVIRVRGALWSDPNVCTSDDECVAVSVDITCEAEGNYFGDCRHAVHVDSQDELAAVNASVAERVCPRAMDCRSAPGCLEAEPRCVAFQCQNLESWADGCLDVCGSLGCADCGARCTAEPACVSAATSCGEVAACGVGRIVTARPFDDGASCLEPSRVVGILETAPSAISGDLDCGVGPDGRAYLFDSGTYRDSLGWPDCDDALAVFDASDC